MPITAQITENNASSVRGTATTPANVAGSTSVGVQPTVTRMAVPGVRGADEDITFNDFVRFFRASKCTRAE